MAAYDKIRPAAYVPVPGAQPFYEAYHTLAFPSAWRQGILDLYKYGKPHRDRVRQVPIASLNAAIRALAPDLVSVAKDATLDDDKPWLYTTSEYPVSVLQSLLVGWLHVMQPSPDAFTILRDTVENLELGSLDWPLTSVDLTEQALTVGGTAAPVRHVYHLLPDILAARIESLPPYEFCGQQVSFRRVATAQGAELMSWPPSVHVPTRKGKPIAPWHFSGTIKITVQTVPFSPVPRVHLTTGIRRWVRGEVRPASGDAATVYLHADGPWLAGTQQSARFAAARLKVRRHRDGVTAAWAHGGPAGIMSWLDVSRDFPEPEALAQDAEAWLDHQDGVTAAVSYHTAMGYHGVATGLMPSERQRLTEWAGRALEPQFKPLADLKTSGYSRTQTTPRPLLAPHKPVPKEPKEKADITPEKLAEIAKAKAKNEQIDIDNALLRRQHLARAIGADRVLSCHLLYQTEKVRDALIAAAEISLDLSGHRVALPVGTWTEGTCTWRTPELELRIHARELSALGGLLGGSNPPKRGRETQQAIEARRREVKDTLAGLGEGSQVVFVELEGRKEFKRRTTDPKFAIRLGCIDAGRVSQFITPEKEPADEGQDTSTREEHEEKSPLEHRAAAAWADGLRQVGMNFVPQHTLGTAIPKELNQLAFWILRRNADGPTWNPQFTPIAILIRPGSDCVMGRTPGTAGWVPYPELLRGLAGQVRGPELKTAANQKMETARFIRGVLDRLRGEPTVVMAYAQNARSRWEWLQDGHITRDKIQLGDLAEQNLALYGGNLRLIRIRDDERNETSQWWAPKDEDHAGHSKGLWVPADAEDDNRVFYATTAKGAAQSKAMNDDTKLTPHISVKTGEPVTNADKPAWNPSLLEIAVVGCTAEDEPADWAMFVQQQRFPDDYRDGLALPLALHLAEQATEYALPHEYTILETPTEGDGDDNTDDDTE